MRFSSVLLRTATSVRNRAVRRMPLQHQVQHVGEDSKKLIRETIETTRDHKWISSNDLSKTKGLRVTGSFKSLSDAQVEGDVLFGRDESFRNLLEELQFKLSRNVSYDRIKSLELGSISNHEYFAKAKTFALKSFEDKLAGALNDFKQGKDMELIHLISPTVDTIPNTLYALLSRDASEKSQRQLNAFFAVSKKLKTIEDKAYHLLESAYVNELKRHQNYKSPVQELKVDITNPAEWYPKARSIKRKLILHVGPTNSGKTYNALKRLRETNNGYFAGPLRLLAREVYDRFKSENIACNLVTGEEVINDIDEFGNSAPLSCGTIEMINLNRYFDVAVIDEIQMIGDADRGWAWTNALLGVRAKEVHLCGEASVVPLIKEIAEMTGDEVIVNKYERLGELKVEDRPLKGIEDLRKGDCIVVFSKKQILNYKADIESMTQKGLKCAVVYGALPAETRSAEANRFNSGESDILIASDAVGMGLNLKIDRMIFSTHKKFDGKNKVQLEPPQVKQIAGRAGRFKTAPVKNANTVELPDDLEKPAKDTGRSIGWVASFDAGTLKYVKKALASETRMLKRAFLWPSDEIWCNYMSEFPKGIEFSHIIKAFTLEVRKANAFQITSAEDRLSLVRVFEKFKELLIDDRLRMSTAPINLRLEGADKVLKEFSQTVANSNTKLPVHFKSLKFEEILSKKITGIQTVDAEVLAELEVLHKFLMVWLWMNNRYPTLFVDRKSANDLKNLIEDRIETILETNEPLTPLGKGSWY